MINKKHIINSKSIKEIKGILEKDEYKISIDTRSINEGEIYIALKGENYWKLQHEDMFVANASIIVVEVVGANLFSPASARSGNINL